ncbi:MAG: c-type cytochrome [Methylotenera sp.]|jgi:cytochrome c|nr:c-type cytochrome [Methylotenera sp.]HPH07650.1 c-type cytochrome [Methylotenera sp.]HPM49596.1 c-type cytochrome [Methylotenera sp.]
MSDFKIIPGDIPLPLPTMGLEFMEPFFHGLLIVAWVVHILFINVLLGASLASVYFNSKGHKEKNPIFDRVAYLLTTPVTISENMGALWGVAPLLLVSILLTPLFYSSSIMISPHWLHIIYGNVVAFLLSYLYKYTWHTLEHRKTLHIFIGVVGVALFYTLPLAFMANVQLAMTPTTWTYTTHFWDALLRADTFFRLVHFYLATFAVTGVFMLVYGMYKRKSADADDRAAGVVLTRTGKTWFIIPTVLNFFVGPLVLFSFPEYGIEAFFENGYFWGIILTVALALFALYLLLKDFFNDDLPAKRVWTVVAVMIVAIISMASLRHGMRMGLVKPVLDASHAKTELFQKESMIAFEEAKNTPATPIATQADIKPGQALAEKHGCLACHNADIKVVGPSYKEVAAKGYTADQIVELVKNPKPDNWPGYMPMPPMPQVPAEDVKQIAEWINSLK